VLVVPPAREVAAIAVRDTPKNILIQRFVCQDWVPPIERPAKRACNAVGPRFCFCRACCDRGAEQPAVCRRENSQRPTGTTGRPFAPETARYRFCADGRRRRAGIGDFLPHRKSQLCRIEERNERRGREIVPTVQAAPPQAPIPPYSIPFAQPVKTDASSESRRGVDPASRMGSR